eukprot:scaffold5807_cov412-Prasinococcus_capsulatus_cf.AAC.9
MVAAHHSRWWVSWSSAAPPAQRRPSPPLPYPAALHAVAALSPRLVVQLLVVGGPAHIQGRGVLRCQFLETSAALGSPGEAMEQFSAWERCASRTCRRSQACAWAARRRSEDPGTCRRPHPCQRARCVCWAS